MPAGDIIFSSKGLEIFGSQVNIAHEVLKKWEAKRLLPQLSGTRCKINYLFLGPSFKPLRTQTLKDLKIWHDATQIGSPGEHAVLNSAKLNREQDPEGHFLTALETEAAAIHLLVHDEAHWGIAEASNHNNEKSF